MFEVLFYSLVGGVVSLIGGMLLLRSKKTAEVLAKYATPFAAGVLLAAAFGDLLPEALEQSADNRGVLLAALYGILGFFILERFLRWFHHHHEHEVKDKASSSLIIIGDTLHNALDGIAIGAAFLIDTPTGIITTTAVAAHEIPQEIGDFGLLLKNGMKRSRVLLVNVLSALATTATALITFGIGDSADFPLPVLLSITAGFFIYIASSDIIPEIHEKLTGDETDYRPFLLLFGAVLILIISPIAHDSIAHEHHDDSHESHSSHESGGHSMHKDYILPDGAMIPEVTLYSELSDSGLSLRVMTEHFTFTPDKEGGMPVAGEGHAHLYINGEKITRIYDEWTFVPIKYLPKHFDEIVVSLSNNDHSEYHLSSGEAISAKQKVNIVGDSHDHDMDHEEHEDENMNMDDDHEQLIDTHMDHSHN